MGDPLTPVQVAELEFKTMFHAKTAGGDADNNNTTIITKGDVMQVDMSKIKTRGDFYDAFNISIAPKGLASHSEERNKILTATMAHYKISELPLS